jgi:hypothetical protein
MSYTFSSHRLAQDWQACKEAHTAAKEMAALQSLLSPGSASPFFQYLSEMANAFKAVHGITFDPNTPIERYEAAEEARDFDIATEARNACLVGAVRVAMTFPPTTPAVRNS